jgi:PIN domain nuclease of toxin-antitoxin system
MDILLDTHAIIWWLEDSPVLPGIWAQEFSKLKNNCFISSASVWEIAIKADLGKISIPKNYLDTLKGQGFIPLPISWNHARAISTLPPVHRDPFDRILIAQAREEKLLLASRDGDIAKYPVTLL